MTEDTRTDEYVRRVVAEAPPLTNEQRVELAELFRPYRDNFTAPLIEEAS